MGVTDIINKNTETLIDANKEVFLEINIKKIKYMLLSRHRNAGQNLHIKVASRSFEHVSQFRYFDRTVTNQNLIDIKKRLNSDNILYHSVQNLSLSLLLSKNIQIRSHKTIILSLVLYGCET
jgi:hypothetical protein